MRRVQRGRRGGHLDHLALRRVGLGLGRVAVLDHRVEHERAARERRGHVLDRVVVRWRLRQTREERHLPERELVQIEDPEVRRRRRLQPVRLIPVVDLVEVHLEDLLLAERPGRLDREDRLLDLSREGRVVPEEAGLDELLGDGRSPLGDAAARAVRLHGARDSADVDAGVRPERLVLDRDRRVLHRLGDRVERDQLTALVRERGEQVLPRAVVNVRRERHGDGREIVGRRQIRGEVTDRRGDPNTDEGDAGEQHRREDARERADGLDRAGATRHPPAAPVREAIGAVRPPGRDSLDGHLPV